MTVFNDISLKPYNSFHLDYRADSLVMLKSESDIIDFINKKHTFGRPFLVIGSGSNLLFTGDFHGTVLFPCNSLISIKEQNGDNAIVSCDAGVGWDILVQWCIDHNLYGLENLSYIPGMAGASPVQNIGAYGVEAKDYIHSVKAISIESGDIRIFRPEECAFAYRSSIFKTEEKGKYIISSVDFLLSVKPVFNLEYGFLKQEVEHFGSVTLKSVREAVIKIRKSKLPDPDLMGNAGSFFKNPIVEKSVFEMLHAKYPDMPYYAAAGNKIKIPAGWLIEKCGWKGKRLGNVAVHDRQSLVIVNCGGASGREIVAFSEKIQKSVFDATGISIEPEVEIIHTT